MSLLTPGRLTIEDFIAIEVPVLESYKCLR